MLSKRSERIVCNNCAATKAGDECHDCTLYGCECSCHYAMTPSRESAPDEQGWLIEKGQLCLGLSCGKPAWVTFTDPAAIRFARKVDAENMLTGLRAMSDKGAFEKCSINDHLWVNP